MKDDYYSHLIPSSVGENDIPPEMGEAFAHNLSALTVFASLSAEKQNELIQLARSVTTHEEMQAFVNGIESYGAIG